jgi:hypothetical protein
LKLYNSGSSCQEFAAETVLSQALEPGAGFSVLRLKHYNSGSSSKFASRSKVCAPVKLLFTAGDGIANLDRLALYRAVMPCETLGAQVKAFIAAEVRPCLIHLLY